MVAPRFMGEGLAGWGAQRAARTAGPPAGVSTRNVVSRTTSPAPDGVTVSSHWLATFLPDSHWSGFRRFVLVMEPPPVTEKAWRTWRCLLSIGSLRVKLDGERTPVVVGRKHILGEVGG